MTGYCDDCGNQDCVCGEMLRAPTTGLAAALTEECLRLRAREADALGLVALRDSQLREAQARAEAAEAKLLERESWIKDAIAHATDAQQVAEGEAQRLRAEVERLTRERDEADESYQYTHRDLIETQDRKLEVEEVRDRYQRQRDEARRLLVALREAWTEYGHCQERWGGCDPATRCTNCALEADIRAFLAGEGR